MAVSQQQNVRETSRVENQGPLDVRRASAGDVFDVDAAAQLGQSYRNAIVKAMLTPVAAPSFVDLENIDDLDAASAASISPRLRHAQLEAASTSPFLIARDDPRSLVLGEISGDTKDQGVAALTIGPPASNVNSNENQSPLEQERSQQKSPTGPQSDEDAVNRAATMIHPGAWESEKHFYPRVLNAQIHPLVSTFFQLGNERIIARYCHLNPMTSESKLRECLAYTPKHFRWAGADLFNVTTKQGQRQMIIVETNSCPSGQKSMPLLTDLEDREHGGYRTVLETAFLDLIRSADMSLGGLAVMYDKNEMEAGGYASALADLTSEPVWQVEFYDNDPVEKRNVKFENGVMFVRDGEKKWHSIRACFRYVTQKPWNRIPLKTRTIVMNSIISCLAGGRNKSLAARAYEFFNSELSGSGLAVRMPETIKNVSKSEIPLWVHSFGGNLVVKIPYSNAGQGVFTITNASELQEFLSQPATYDKFIVQSLVGNASWSSITREGQFYHVGTIPNKKNNTFVSDLRVMVCAGVKGFEPVAIYARRARKPLVKNLADHPETTSWEMLGTNLSVKLPNGRFTTESQRLLLMDRKDFNQLGISLDDLIDSYVQTTLSVIAIDKLARRLVDETTGDLDWTLFRALNPDEVLLDEIKTDS